MFLLSLRSCPFLTKWSLTKKTFTFFEQSFRLLLTLPENLFFSKTFFIFFIYPFENVVFLEKLLVSEKILQKFVSKPR